VTNVENVAVSHPSPRCRKIVEATLVPRARVQNHGSNVRAADVKIEVRVVRTRERNAGIEFGGER
jgi:hypothetical protein